MDQFSKDQTGQGDWKVYSNIPNSATHFMALRMSEFGTLKYKLKTDINAINPFANYNCNKLPKHIKEELHEHIVVRGQQERAARENKAKELKRR